MPPRILIAEDDPLIAESFRMAFEAEQFDVTVVHSGDSAIKELSNSEFDVVITDLVMKDGGGVLVTGMSRLLQKVPNVIVVSGRYTVIGEMDTEETVRKLGAKYTFSKPVDFEELIAAVNSLLKESDK